MYTHFLRMLANEAGTRLGEDIEALHDMRVATRRMRAAYRIFEAYFDPKALKPFNKSLRRTGATLGAVRDLDVLLEAAETYQAALPEEAGAALAPLLDDWRARREVARRQLLDYLDSGAYRRFVTDFEVFLATPGAGARPIPPGEPIPYQVCHVAPRLVIERYETVRAYEPVLRDGAPLTSYHMLRIDCKRLRYVLEFFKEVLGPEAAGVIKQVTAMQDVLGALQDAHVAEGLIQAFLDEQHNKRKKAALAPLAGVTRYFEVQRAAQQELLAQFSAPWAELLGADFRRSLALAVAAL
jgi:CHAD domain-containing protein